MTDTGSNDDVVRSGFCYHIHEAHPSTIECMASWQSLCQGLICAYVFYHLLKKVGKAQQRALAGRAKNTINIDSHNKAFIGVIVFYILWTIGNVFDINRNYKYTELKSPGFQGKDISLLTPLLIGSVIVRGFSNFLEFFIGLLLLSDSIGNRSYETAWITSTIITAMYVPCIFCIIVWSPGYTAIYWPLRHLAILYLARDLLAILFHGFGYFYARDRKTHHKVNDTIKTYFLYMTVVYSLFFMSKFFYLTFDFVLVNMGICIEDTVRIVQFAIWGPLAYLVLKRDCQYWLSDLDTEEENEETLLSYTENMTWTEASSMNEIVIPKSEMYFRKKIVETMDTSVEIHLWRRRLAVVKRFTFDLLTRDNIKNFKHEARVLNGLKHPNVVEFLGILVDPPSLGIVMTYAKNGDLFKYLAKLQEKAKNSDDGQGHQLVESSENGSSTDDTTTSNERSQTDEIPSPRKSPNSDFASQSGQSGRTFLGRSFSSFSAASEIEMKNLKEFNPIRCMIQIASGMAYLHDNSIIHKDLKSLNILLDDNFNALIADFGDSDIESSQKSSVGDTATHIYPVVGRSSFAVIVSSSNNNRRSSGERKFFHQESGTPGWAAPECMKGKSATKDSDVFSFATIMWECLTYHAPAILLSDEEAASLNFDVKQDHPAFSPMHMEDGGVGGQSTSNTMVEICEKGVYLKYVCNSYKRPPIPLEFPSCLSRLLIRCWSEPSNRPSFLDILQMLRENSDELKDLRLPARTF